MSVVISYAVGNGDMFSIQHNSDNFTIIDCSIRDDRETILEALKEQSKGKGIQRFISTHPDQDHIMGLEDLDDTMNIVNFYCVKNKASKDDETDDFKRYCDLRDDDGKAFYLYKGCTRKWMNLADEKRGSAGIRVHWPDINNEDFKSALREAAEGNSPNNISPVVTYSIENGGSFAWMGDLETVFMEKIQDEVNWPSVNVLFAPHHGRDSGKVPTGILLAMDPDIVVIGEAPSEHLNYYAPYNTITQNTAGSIGFECIDRYVHIYVSSDSYSVDFLVDHQGTSYANYIGTLEV